jgi:hypothetical protein
VRQQTRPLAQDAALVHARGTPWHEPFVTHERRWSAQHSWAAVHVALPHSTAAVTPPLPLVVPPDAVPPLVVPPDAAPPDAVPPEVAPLGSAPESAPVPLLEPLLELVPPSIPSDSTAPPHPINPQQPRPRSAVTNALEVMMAP